MVKVDNFHYDDNIMEPNSHPPENKSKKKIYTLEEIISMITYSDDGEIRPIALAKFLYNLQCSNQS